MQEVPRQELRVSGAQCARRLRVGHHADQTLQEQATLWWVLQAPAGNHALAQRDSPEGEQLRIKIYGEKPAGHPLQPRYRVADFASSGDLSVQTLQNPDAHVLDDRPEERKLGWKSSIDRVLACIARRCDPLHGGRGKALRGKELRVASSHSGNPDAAIHARADAILARLDIGHLALRPIDEISGGQRQLVSLAQAIVRRPAILLLDEPTSALDAGHQIDVMEAVGEASANDGMIVLAVMHDLNLALRWADSIVLLAEGSLITAGPPAVAVTAENLAAAYHVAARIERCSRGRLHVLFDERVP